jgi:hypothetical protein
MNALHCPCGFSVRWDLKGGSEAWDAHRARCGGVRTVDTRSDINFDRERAYADEQAIEASEPPAST